MVSLVQMVILVIKDFPAHLAHLGHVVKVLDHCHHNQIKETLQVISMDFSMMIQMELLMQVKLQLH